MRQGVDLTRFEHLDPARARTRFAAELGDEPFVLVLGRVGRQKDPLLAIDAFARSGFTGNLVFAGASMDVELDRTMVERARAHGVAERVVRLGNVEPAHVPDLLAASALLLVTSMHEAFGLQVLEGWAARRPVLFASVGGLTDLGQDLDDARAVLATRDPATWGARLGALLSAPGVLQSMASRGRARVENGHTWVDVARRHQELYASVSRGARCVA
jgi:glycosyltransferase involved in cell wall biosynthesis